MGDFLYRYNSEALSQFTCPPSAKLDIATQKLSVDYGASGHRDAPDVSGGIAETIRMQADCGCRKIPADHRCKRASTEANKCNVTEGRPSGEGAA
jgi:hypothetical protein